MEISLNLENKAAARKEIKKIQQAIDDLVNVCSDQKQQLLANIKVIDSAKEQITNLTNSAIGLSDALKSAHIILQSRKHLFKDDEEIKILFDSLATFVVSSGAIKLGVLSNAKK